MPLTPSDRAMVRTLFSEVVFGSPDTNADTYMLNRGDVGLLASLDALPTASASASANGGASIAAHAEHLRYGLSLMNRWANGDVNPWKDADWTRAWTISTVTDDEWRSLRTQLRDEAERWRASITKERDVSEHTALWIMGSVSHTAYHLGAIRQIARGARGPTAEDEAALRKS